MNDIFLSYKREEQSAARTLADALEKQGWTVWWDPKLRAGERFDDVIEAALKESKCVVVMWSNLSVNSRYVKDEATYALNRNKLVPVRIEQVELPFRFEALHTPDLVGWDGAEDFSEFRRFVDDISLIVRPRTINRQRNDVNSNRRAPQRKNANPPKSASEELPQQVTPHGGGSGFDPGMVFQDTLKDGSLGPEMVVVSAGKFQMGDIQGGGESIERPVHSVRILKPFAIGKYPVTFEEYDKFASAIGWECPGDAGWGRDRRPAINVSWLDTVKFSEWLSKEVGRRYRLPTEAEWEYAARAGTKTAYWWGNRITPGMANWTAPH